MTPIRLGVVGAGAFAASPHRSVVEAQPDRFEVVALYDSTQTGGMNWTSRTHAAAYESLDDLLSHRQIEAVFVAHQQVSARFEAAQRALAAGFHVVIDPPMAASAAQCDQLIQLARRQRVVLTVAHLRRWDNGVVHARSRIQSGEIGDPLLVKLAGSFPAGDNIVLSEGFALFDDAQSFNESRLEEVSAVPNARRRDALDAIIAQFRFAEPPAVEVTLFESAAGAGFPLPRLLIVGGRGVIADASPLDAPNAQTFYDGLWKAIRQRSAPPVVAASARNAVYLAECAMESARRGQTIRAERLLKAVE